MLGPLRQARFLRPSWAPSWAPRPPFCAQQGWWGRSVSSGGSSSSTANPERMGTCAELGCGPSALSGHSKSGDVLGLTNEKKTLSGNVKPPVVVPGDEFATNLQSAEMMLSECRFGEAWGFSTRALLVHSSGRGRRIKPWERAICYLLRAEALLDMGAPRRALTELHPAKELLERGRQGWPTEALKRIEEADARYHARKEENDQQRIEKENAKVPVTVITGFLGSGKTTLLNRILREQHGKRIAVIENEFGEVGIDSMLVEQAERTTETIVEMNNGCICCTLRGDFIEGMQKVLKDVRARGSHLDSVFIETTGLADPSPIASTFFLDPFMQENYRLDSILGVCDAKHLLSQLEAKREKSCVNEASEQVAFSDRLLLTKTDLCSEMEINGVLQHLKRLNPFAQVLPLNLKDVETPLPVEQLCDVKAFSLDKALDFDATFLEEDDHTHDGTIQALGVKLNGVLHQEKLNVFFAAVLKRYPKEMYRMKGILDVKGIPERYIFHAVNCHFGGMPQGSWPTEERQSKAVFIGKGIDHAWLVEGLRNCFVDPKEGFLESNVKSAHE
ncbi:unnamed protein product [Durusdinium trenchii]|uniref:CobW C-terminal domain-containing protein n=1 Tax=Durusdinium trenchii TaxID=1381693 RepID=A0ABP0MLP2_9DINO